MGPRHGGAGGQQDQRIDERQAPGVEGAVEGVAGLGRPVPAGQGVALDHAVDFLARLDRAVRHGDVDGIDGGREQRGVEVGPEPGDEEHHLRGNEQDHAVAQVQLHHRGMVAAMRFLDDIAPPHDHGQQQAEHADGEYQGPSETEEAAAAAQRAHPDDQADSGDEGRRGAHGRPRAGVHQVIIVGLGVRVGHASCSLIPSPAATRNPISMPFIPPGRCATLLPVPQACRRRASRRDLAAARPQDRTCRTA